MTIEIIKIESSVCEDFLSSHEVEQPAPGPSAQELENDMLRSAFDRRLSFDLPSALFYASGYFQNYWAIFDPKKRDNGVRTLWSKRISLDNYDKVENGIWALWSKRISGNRHNIMGHFQTQTHERYSQNIMVSENEPRYAYSVKEDFDKQTYDFDTRSVMVTKKAPKFAHSIKEDFNDDNVDDTIVCLADKKGSLLGGVVFASKSPTLSDGEMVRGFSLPSQK